MTAGVVTGLVTLLTVFLVWVAAELIGREAVGWVPRLSRGLVRRASRRLPPEHRQRYLEEWTAELEQLTERPISALVFAVGVTSAARSLRGQLVAPGARRSRRSVRSAVESWARNSERLRAAFRREVDAGGKAARAFGHAAALGAREVYESLRWLGSRNADELAAVFSYFREVGREFPLALADVSRASTLGLARVTREFPLVVADMGRQASLMLFQVTREVPVMLGDVFRELTLMVARAVPIRSRDQLTTVLEYVVLLALLAWVISSVR